MSNIINELKYISDADLRLQIALFQSITVMGVAKETGYRAVKKIVQVANSFIGKSESDLEKIDYGIEGIVIAVKNNIKQLKTKTRPELIDILKENIIQKCNELKSGSLDEFSSEQLMSIVITKEAAKMYELDCDMPIGRLAQNISQQYYLQFLNRLHKSLLKENSEQIKITDNNLQQQLNKMPIEEKREFSKNIPLKEFSGRGIGSVLRKEKDTKYLEIVVQYMGMAVFDILETVIFAIFDRLAGFNRLQRALLAQLVWVSFGNRAVKLTVNYEGLPSYVPDYAKETQAIEEKEYRYILDRKKQLENNYEMYNSGIEKLKSRLLDSQVKLLEENLQYEESKREFEKLEAMKGTKLAQENSDKEYFKDVVFYKKKYDEASETIKKRNILISDMKIEISKTTQELSECNAELKAVNEKAALLIEQKRAQISVLWKAFFYKFQFAEEIFESLVIDFAKKEIMLIEEYMKEMHDSNDIKAFGIKAITDDKQENGEESNEENNQEKENLFNVKCSVGNGKKATIGYNDIFIKYIRKEDK